MRSIVAHGHHFELFTYDPEIKVPDWVERRDAREILPAEHVLVYRSGWGAGSAALHSDIFRYALLHQLGGWWVDLDIVLLQPHVPSSKYFCCADVRGLVISGVLHFPPRDSIIMEALGKSRTVREETARWGEIGPELLDAIITKQNRRDILWPTHTAYPLDYYETDMLFDPTRTDEVEQRCASSYFLHWFHQLNRSSAIPPHAGPPKGSFLDRLFELYQVDTRFEYRLRHADVKTWITNFLGYLHFEALYQREVAQAEKLRSRCSRLERDLAGSVSASLLNEAAGRTADVERQAEPLRQTIS